MNRLPRECVALKTAGLEPAREVTPLRYLVAEAGGNRAFRDIADAGQLLHPV